MEHWNDLKIELSNSRFQKFEIRASLLVGIKAQLLGDFERTNKINKAYFLPKR